MSLLSPCLSSLLLLTIFISKARAQYLHHCDFTNRGNYTPISAYRTNLNTLLSTLTSNTEISYGFYNLSNGHDTDTVNAIGLCRGDVKPDECRSCLNASKDNLLQLCPNQKEAIGWNEDKRCMLRYSDRSIFNLVENGPAYFAWSVHNATQTDQFNEVVKDLLNDLKGRAVSGDSRYKYATGNMSGPNYLHVYGLVQCTPDLSVSDCDNCLVQSITDIPKCCNSKRGARILRPSCNLRFETSPFYGPPAYPSPSPNITSSQGKSNTSTIITIAVPLLVIAALLLIFIYIFLRVRKPKEKLQTSTPYEMLQTTSLNQINLDEAALGMFTSSGYMAPEYAMHGQFSIKSDVFSFGVLVLEIVSGQKNRGIRDGEYIEDLLSYAWRNWKEGTPTNVIDTILNKGSQSEIMRCIHIGLLCVQENVAGRPTMASVVLALNSHSLTLPVPSEPAFYAGSTVGSFSGMHLWEYNLGATGSSENSAKSAQTLFNEASTIKGVVGSLDSREKAEEGEVFERKEEN
ncbi:hypothetical protein RJT34_25287 [Clitoria ternatea]|uniref:Gnk2-homologous domain-containing protein n=1 Tax=Clitoria ternatea TaxID=43366 RepID=A0AAN9IJW3_CLITE